MLRGVADDLRRPSLPIGQTHAKQANDAPHPQGQASYGVVVGLGADTPTHEERTTPTHSR
jgi:hypothetical protein